jgi:hypothetical protein
MGLCVSTLAHASHNGRGLIAKGDEMKLFGYVDQGLDVEHIVPSALAEVTLCASPQELRRMAEFLLACASEMERMGGSYDHVHLGDRMKEFDEVSPHFVVAKAVS